MSISVHTGSNIGGINPVQFVFAQDIASFVIDPRTLIGTIVLKDRKYWNDLYGSPDSIQIEGKEEDTPAGVKYSYTLKMLIPKDRQIAGMALFMLNNYHLIFSVTDKNNVSRYFGTLQSPMRKTGKLLKPAAIDGYSGWEVQFDGSFSQPSCYSSVAGSIIPPDPTG